MGLTLTKSLKKLADNEKSSFCLEGYHNQSYISLADPNVEACDRCSAAISLGGWIAPCIEIRKE
jgi:hypothetical protein